MLSLSRTENRQCYTQNTENKKDLSLNMYMYNSFISFTHVQKRLSLFISLIMSKVEDCTILSMQIFDELL